MSNTINQMSTTGQAAKKKCKERVLLKLAYWKIKLPKNYEQLQYI